MKSKITVKQLIQFEKEIGKLWESAQILSPVHFSGGNELELIKIFKEIADDDYVFSTHRSHYHYLLKGGSQETLKAIILRGDSMHVFDKNLNFLSTAIVAGGVAIAVGIALGLKLKGTSQKVWCFLGDGAEDQGHFYEAVRYVAGHDLPCIFVIEDNNRSVETPKSTRYGNASITWPNCVRRYKYKATYPHVGTAKWVDFLKDKTL